METELELYGKIEGGHFPMETRLRISDAMRRMEGKRIGIKLYEPKKASSNPQRRYYFGVIVEAIRYMFVDAGTLLTKEEMHHWLMENVGKWFKEIVTPDGEISRTRRSYNDLERAKETELHHTLCRQWAAERGLQIREPNEDD